MPAEFNEELVRAYYENKGYFVRMNVPYRFVESRGDASDVDIVALNPVTNDCVACEVKGWFTENFTRAYLNEPRMLNFTSTAATKAVRDLTGREDFERVLVVSQLGPVRPDDTRAAARELGVTLLTFGEILDDMLAGISLNANARNQSDHVLRVLLALKRIPRPIR